jgi:hypothetical protein
VLGCRTALLLQDYPMPCLGVPWRCTDCLEGGVLDRSV